MVAIVDVLHYSGDIFANRLYLTPKPQGVRLTLSKGL